MAASVTTPLIPIGNGLASSNPFNVPSGGSASIYLYPATGNGPVPSSATLVIYRVSSDGGRLISTYTVRGNDGEAIIVGAGDFVATRPEQNDSFGVDIVV